MDRERKRFDFSIDEEFEQNDETLLEADLDEDDIALPFGGVDSISAPVVRKLDDRPPRERIEELLASLKHRKRVLLDTLDFVREPKSVAEVNGLIDELQANNVSVYSGPDICAMLEKAGAIKRVAEDGSDLPSGDLEPEIMVEDGIEVYKPVVSPPVFWLATDVGIAVRDEYDPLSNARQLFESEAVYAPIFKRVLELADSNPGAKTAIYTDAIDDDPLVQEPRRYASFFMDKLESVDAVEWRDGWFLTDTGREALKFL